MKNMDDLTELAREILKRRANAAGHDIYSDIYGEISTDELKYRKSQFEAFLCDAAHNDGTYDEVNHIIEKINEKLDSRK